MTASNVVYDKSLDFAVRIVNLYKYLTENKREFVLSKQLLRSGTSIGANIAEADCAISRADFIAKIYISLKECSESLYWLTLLHKTEFIDDVQYESMMNGCNEIYKILSAITFSTKKKATQ